MRNSIQWTRGTVQRFWARVPLREKGLFAAGLPMLAVIFSATMAFFGNEERERTEAAVRRHFSMIENLATSRRICSMRRRVWADICFA